MADLSLARNIDKEPLLEGRYRLDTPLGEGGMGQVFQAEHVLMKKTVAIKILRAELSEDPEMVARFQREAQAAAALDSPNVCQATDFGQTQEGSFFLVMEFLDGETLQQRLKSSGRLPQEKALHILRQIAQALTEAHQLGIVHRDLKPENIMLIERDGDPDFVKIMDFGIARIVASANSSGLLDEDAPKLTRKGLVYGTPHYMSPEQVAGEEVDHRSDLYALGVILFEMLTGAPPFDDDSIARVMAQHVTSPAPRLSERCSAVEFAAPLEDLVAHLLAKGRDERPSSAAEIVDALDKLADSPSQLVASTPAPSPSLAISQAQSFWSSLTVENRRLAIIAALATAMTLLAIILAAAAILTLRDKPPADFEQARQALAEDQALVHALEAAAAGERDALDQLLKEQGDNPHLRYLVLMADLEAKRTVDVVSEAAHILELEKKYAHDDELINLLATRLHTKDHGEAARELLSNYFSPTTRDALAEIATVGSSNSRRNAAFELLTEKNALAKLEQWQRLSVELRQAKGCTEHREKIQAIQALGDPRALQTLKALQATPTTGCGTLRLQDCLGCIRGDLREAIKALESE